MKKSLFFILILLSSSVQGQNISNGDSVIMYNTQNNMRFEAEIQQVLKFDDDSEQYFRYLRYSDYKLKIRNNNYLVTMLYTDNCGYQNKILYSPKDKRLFWIRLRNKTNWKIDKYNKIKNKNGK